MGSEPRDQVSETKKLFPTPPFRRPPVFVFIWWISTFSRQHSLVDQTPIDLRNLILLRLFDSVHQVEEALIQE